MLQGYKWYILQDEDTKDIELWIADEKGEPVNYESIDHLADKLLREFLSTK